MVKSMTGYGRGEAVVHGRSITVELRSVNNRYLDCTIKLPRIYVFAEDAIKSKVQAHISKKNHRKLCKTSESSYSSNQESPSRCINAICNRLIVKIKTTFSILKTLAPNPLWCGGFACPKM